MSEIFILNQSNTEQEIIINSAFFLIIVVEENTTNAITTTTVWDGATIELYDKYDINDTFIHIQGNDENVIFQESNIRNEIQAVGGTKPYSVQLKLINSTANTKIIIRTKQ